MASLTDALTKSRVNCSESLSPWLSSGWRCDSSTDVTRKAAAERSCDWVLHGRLDEGVHPAGQRGLSLRELQTRRNHQCIGLSDHFLVQHALAGEVSD